MPASPTHLFDRTVTVQRVTDAVDSGGGPTKTWSDHIADIPARVQPMSGAESRRYGRESNRRSWRVFMTPGHDITEEDRIQFSDRTVSGAAVTTRTLDIQEINHNQLDGRVLAIIAEETD